MPPKQKQSKKGPTYKTGTALKDLIPASVKQAPRESRPIKTPDSYPQIKNVDNEALLAEFPPLFEQWPAQQTVKGVDFGIASDKKFEDNFHENILNFVTDEKQQGCQIHWKNFQQLDQIRKTFQKQNPDYNSSEGQPEENKEQKKQENEANQQNKESQPKIQQPPQQTKQRELVIIQTYMRQQTQQQMQRRKQQQAEKAAQNAKDKKKGKKQQPKQDGPMQISDVKMSDIRVRKSMIESAIWIGSHLQIIKERDLRDVYTGQSVWKKIYPQQNGVPKITQSGKYWVKLYYMGKPIKIQVDDRIPVDEDNNQLLPISRKKNQMWTLILAKAVIKLFIKASPQKCMVGSGLMIYALTGMITENVPLNGFKDWKKIQKYMSNECYTQKNILMNVFSRIKDKNSPTNYIYTDKDSSKRLLQLQNSTFKRKKINKQINISSNQQGQEILSEGKIMEHEGNVKYIDNNVINGYSYCVGDYFQNGNFNMSFARDRNQTEKQLREQYSQFSKVSLANKSRQEKLEHRRRKKQIKQKLQAEQKKRLQEINRPCHSYHFLKLLGNVSILCQYTNREILLAKKCILNDLQKPPNYQIPTVQKQKQSKQETKSGISTSIVKMSKQEINSGNIDVNPSLDDFSGLQKQKQIKQILMRNQLGVWIQDQDLLSTFDEIQIFYNPNSSIFNNNVAIQNVQMKYIGEFSQDENAQILMIQKAGNPHLQGEQNHQQQDQGKQPQNIKLLFGYSYQKSKYDTLCSPYTMLQKFDFDSYVTTNTVTKLSSLLCSSFLQLKNQNTIFKLYTMCKGRYAYWISCSAAYKLMSISKYLEQIQNYSSQTINIEYPPIEALTYFPIARIKISQKNKQGNSFILKFQNSPAFKNIQKFLNLKVIEIPSLKSEGGVVNYTVQKNQGVIQKTYETIHLLNQYTRFQLQTLPQDIQQKQYYLVIEAFPNISISDGSLSLQILAKNQGDQISQIQQIEPYKIVQKYLPNKYGNIMKQRIYTSKSNNVSLLFKIIEGQQGQPLAAGGKGGNKKGGKQEQVFQIVEKPLEQRRLIHFKIFKNQHLFYYCKGYNQITIPNIYLCNKDDQKQNEYYIETSFDLRDWPQANSNQETNKIYWSCQVYGDEAIAFVKDTKQEQKQKQTKKSWEDKQPGRAEKAKKSRQRYLLQCKRDNGQQLTEQQLAIVNAPKLTKKQLLQQQKKNEDKKGGKGAKKDDKKGAKDKKQEVLQDQKQQRQFPKSQDNFMNQVKQFLKNLEDCKVQHLKLKQGQEARIRSHEEQQALKQAASMSAQNRIGQIIRNIQNRETMKIKQKDKKDKLTILLEDSRNAFESEWKKYIEWRIEDKQKDRAKQQKQKAIIELITTAIDKQKTVTSTEADLQKIITDYKEIEGYNEQMVEIIEMIRKNVKISGLVQKINGFLGGWQIDQLKAIKQEMEKDRVEGIDEQILKQMNQMLQQAEKNPTMVQQKQAQLKKGKKGGKK